MGKKEKKKETSEEEEEDPDKALWASGAYQDDEDNS